MSHAQYEPIENVVRSMKELIYIVKKINPHMTSTVDPESRPDKDGN